MRNLYFPSLRTVDYVKRWRHYTMTSMFSPSSLFTLSGVEISGLGTNNVNMLKLCTTFTINMEPDFSPFLRFPVNFWHLVIPKGLYMWRTVRKPLVKTFSVKSTSLLSVLPSSKAVKAKTVGNWCRFYVWTVDGGYLKTTQFVQFSGRKVAFPLFSFILMRHVLNFILQNCTINLLPNFD